MVPCLGGGWNILCVSQVQIQHQILCIIHSPSINQVNRPSKQSSMDVNLPLGGGFPEIRFMWCHCASILTTQLVLAPTFISEGWGLDVPQLGPIAFLSWSQSVY